MSETDARMLELDAAAAEDEIQINAASKRGLMRFIALFGDPSAIFLLDTGNYRANWQNDAQSAAFEFTADHSANAIILPRISTTP